MIELRSCTFNMRNTRLTKARMHYKCVKKSEMQMITGARYPSLYGAKHFIPYYFDCHALFRLRRSHGFTYRWRQTTLTYAARPSTDLVDETSSELREIADASRRDICKESKVP